MNDDLHKYFQEYLRKYFGGKGLETEFETQLYKRYQEAIDRRRKQMQERVMERLGRTGTLGMGVGEQALTELVETPIAEAEAGLTWQRLQAQEAERLRREGTAMGLAKERVAEEEAARQRRSGLFGRLAGGVVGGALTGISGGPMGMLAGAGLGLIGAVGAGGGTATPTTPSGMNELYMQIYEDILRRLRAGENIELPSMELPPLPRG